MFFQQSLESHCFHGHTYDENKDSKQIFLIKQYNLYHNIKNWMICWISDHFDISRLNGNKMNITKKASSSPRTPFMLQQTPSPFQCLK